MTVDEGRSGVRKHVQIHRGGGWEAEKWMKTPFFCLCHWASTGSRSPLALSEKSPFSSYLKKQNSFQLLGSDLSVPSIGICSWKKTPDLCHAREWVSPTRRPRLGWEGELCPRSCPFFFYELLFCIWSFKKKRDNKREKKKKKLPVRV